MQQAQRLPDLVFNATDLPMLADAAQRFTTLALVVTVSQKGPYWDALRPLNDMRPFLERFRAILKNAQCPDPIETLDAAGDRDYGNVAKILNMSHACTMIAAHLGKILAIAVCEHLKRHPPPKDPITVDPKKLH